MLDNRDRWVRTNLKLTWGGTVDGGFTPVSHFFLRNYASLGIDNDEAMTLLQVIDFAVKDGDKPFPSIDTLAARMGLCEKTVRTIVGRLREKGFVIVEAVPGRSNRYDFMPLFEKLEALAGTPVKVTDHPSQDLPTKETQSKETSPEPSPTERVLAPLAPAPVSPQSELEDSEPDEPPKPRPKAKRLPSPAPVQTPTLAPPPALAHPSAVVSSMAQPAAKSSKLGQLLDRALGEARAKAASRVATPTRQQTFESKPIDKFNCNDIELVMRQAWSDKGWENPPRFTGRDRKHAKDLLDQYGPQKVSAVVYEVIVKWETYKAKFSLRGAPSMPMFWGFRTSLFHEVLVAPATKQADKPKWGAHFDKAVERDDADVVGWG